MLVDSRVAAVQSFAYGRDQFYADKHEAAPLAEQSAIFKASFAESAGQSAAISYWEHSDCDVTYTGQLTFFEDKQGSHLPHLSIGQESLSLDFPVVRQQIRSSMTDLGKFSNVVVCLQGGGYNLHHYLFEILPSMIIYRDLLERRKEILVGSTSGSHFIHELNDILDLRLNIKEIPINSRFHLDSFDVLGHFLFRVYPIEILQKIREKIFCTNLTVRSDSKVVFIGRGDNERNRRHLTNEPDVLNLLKFKFKNVDLLRPALSSMAITIGNLRNAKIIVGQTGGALANLMWAENLEQFIELVPRDYHGTTEAEELSKLLGFEYKCVFTENFVPGNWRYENQVCDLSELASIIDSIL